MQSETVVATSPSSSSRSSLRVSDKLRKLPPIRLPNNDDSGMSSSTNLERRNTMDSSPTTKRPNPFEQKLNQKPVRKTSFLNAECHDSIVFPESSFPERRRSMDYSPNETINMPRSISIGKRMDLLDKLHRQNSFIVSQRSISSIDTDGSQCLRLKCHESPIAQQRKTLSRSANASEKSTATDSTGDTNATPTETRKIKPVPVTKTIPLGGKDKVVVDLKIHLLNDIKEQSHDSMSNCDTERNDMPNDSTSSEKTFSLGTMWSKFTKSMRNMLDDLDGRY